MIDNSLYPPLVTLNPNTHEYTDSEGSRYMGFSYFCDEFLARKFNASGAAYGVAKSSINKGEIISAQSVLDKWEGQRDLGVRVDKAITEYLTTKLIAADNSDIADLIKSVCAEYDSFKTIITQGVVYNKNYKIAGSPDLFVLTSNRQDGQFEMSDFKVFEKGVEDLYDHKGWFFPPMAHLSITKYSKIALQLGYYAYQLEELLGKRCRKLFIHLINPITQTHTKVVVPYLRHDIILLLEHNKDKIKEYSFKQQESIF